MSLLSKNEKEANMIVAKVMRVTFCYFYINLFVKCDRDICG